DDGGEDNHYNDAAEGGDNNGNEDDASALDTVATKCSFLHLKLVRLNKITGKAREMRWLKLILKNAKALVTMTISCDPTSDMKSENVMADISSLPRASASCAFKFSPQQGNDSIEVGKYCMFSTVAAMEGPITTCYSN
ncbi:hypothetical protein C5167_025383, partial [Papaver somniferum]